MASPRKMPSRVLPESKITANDAFAEKHFSISSILCCNTSVTGPSRPSPVRSTSVNSRLRNSFSASLPWIESSISTFSNLWKVISAWFRATFHLSKLKYWLKSLMCAFNSWKRPIKFAGARTFFMHLSSSGVPLIRLSFSSVYIQRDGTLVRMNRWSQVHWRNPPAWVQNGILFLRLSFVLVFREFFWLKLLWLNLLKTLRAPVKAIGKPRGDS